MASKPVSALGTMSKAMLVYQPRGLGERGAILQALDSPSELSTITDHAVEEVDQVEKKSL